MTLIGKEVSFCAPHYTEMVVGVIISEQATCVGVDYTSPDGQPCRTILHMSQLPPVLVAESVTVTPALAPGASLSLFELETFTVPASVTPLIPEPTPAHAPTSRGRYFDPANTEIAFRVADVCDLAGRRLVTVRDVTRQAVPCWEARGLKLRDATARYVKEMV